MSKQIKKNLGPIQRIVVPKFDFGQAEKEERYVDDVIDAQMQAQDQDPRKLGLAMRNPKAKNEFEGSVKDSQRLNDELKEKMSLNKAIFRPKPMKSQDQQQLGNFRIKTKNISSVDLKQDLFSPSSHEIGSSMQSKLQQEWIDKMSKKELPKGPKRPARHPDKIISNMRGLQSPGTGSGSNYNVTVKGTLGEEFAEIEKYDPDSAEENPLQRAFANGGLNTNKNLKNYDCWDEEKTPYEWIKECKQRQSPHAKCPMYDKSKKYVWSNVEVQDWDEEAQKFKVKVMETGIIKLVGRLSIMFLWEDPIKFQERVELSKQRQRNADDEIRFFNFVDKVNDKVASSLPMEVRKKIISFASSREKQALKKDESKSSPKIQQSPDRKQQQNTQDEEKQENSNIQQMQTSLLKQIEMEYVLMMKKCYILRDMEFNKHDPKWIKLRIRNRFTPNQRKYYGLYVALNYNMRDYREPLFRLHYSCKKLVVDTLNMVASRSQTYQNYPVLNIQLNQNQLPMTLSNFDSQQKQHNIQARQTLQVQWRSYIVSEIQDKLRDIYRFYQTETTLYKDSELQRLLKRIDFMFNTYLRDNVLKQSVESWCNFVKRFTIPDSSEKEIWQINDYPMIILNMEVNLNFKRKKDKPVKKQKERKDKEKDDEEEKKESDEPISYEPSLQQIQQVLLKPLEWLVETVNAFYQLEKDLVPLVDIDKKKGYEIDNTNEWIEWGNKNIIKYVQLGFKRPQEVLEDFKRYSFLLEKSVTYVQKQLFGESKEKPNILMLEREEIHNKLQEFYQARFDIERLCLDEKNERFFQIRTRLAKEGLISRANDFIHSILTRCGEIVTENIERVVLGYQEMRTRVLKQPKNEQELVDLKSYLAENAVNLAKMKKEVDCIYEYLVMFEDYNYHYPERNIENFWDLQTWPTEIKMALIEGSRNSQNQETKLMENLESEKEKFQKELLDLAQGFQAIQKMDNYKMVKENATEVLHINDRLEKAQEKVKSFNEREVLFKQQISDYEDLNGLLRDYEPYHKLWDIAMEFDLDKQDWNNGSFLKLTFVPIEKKVNQFYLRESSKLQKIFGDVGDDVAGNVAKEMRNDVDKFREKLWLIELLTTEAMIKKLSHWKDIFKECNIQEIEPNDEMTLQVIIETGLPEHREIIEEISRRADKQWSIEKKLNEIIEKLRDQKVEMIPFKASGTYVLRSLDEVQQLLDDQLNILMMMKASPYIKAVINKANALELKIVLIQDTLEGWIKCQRGWMYLEPIFGSDDIKKKMPKEREKFESIDKSWRACMEQYSKEPLIWEGIEGDRLKNEFDQNNKILEQIQKSLSEYLETKRRFFPRFYFLSDEELLEILAQTKDPETVQKHINKCFEAISQLEFDPNQEVVAMISGEKEKIKFNKPINVNEGEKKGNVERWLYEIEQVMIDTLKKITKSALVDEDTKRTVWVRKWAAQTVLSVNMIRWTKGAERSIMIGRGDIESDEKNPQFNNLSAFLEKLITELRDVVELVRQDLSPLERLTLGALVVLDVHGRDVVRQLVKEGCSSVQDFSWIAQLRYYWEENSREQILKVCMINAELKYGFEYLGNSMRLVITPLTDRCYRTLMGAFHLYYGGAPEGPAGTGKTETVKDLAKALAVQCVVFNCSDGLNYLAMSKFFKGLASSGAWCCFDEFNRIDLEVLSVIAQQVLSIQSAIREKKRVFTFGGEEITLIPSCAINITMNPGYAGRSDLPDNLKALFRPCAMMVPDYALISEIYLSSVGFQDAQNLARKIVASLRLSSEQLSSQDHYDFGMRALKAILTAAGNLKRTMNEIEDIICLRALMDVNLPKFTVNDVPLFLSITSDLFPGVKLPEIDYGRLEQALKNISTDLLLQPEKGFIEKCIQLFDTINVRHGLMIVGQAFSGKSRVLECLGKGMTSLKGFESFVPCVFSKLNPKSITSDQLYGRLDPDTKSWTDGVIAIIMRECAKDSELAERKWIIFDGPVDAVWIENMNTVLDDNKKLCLTSGEIIKMTSWMTMMFEVEDLSQASPATVSRCGMVFLEAQQIGWLALAKSAVQRIPVTLDKSKPLLLSKLQWIIDSSLAWCNKYGKFPIYKNEMTMVKNLLEILMTFTLEFQDESQKLPKEIDEILGNALLFSCVWSIGAALDEVCRKKYNEFLQKLISAAADIPEQYKIDLQYTFEPYAIHAKLPEKSNLFEMVYDRPKNVFLAWTQTQPPFIIPKGVEYHQLLIPTSDSIRNNHFLHLCVRNKLHLLVSGPTGTGKTSNIVSELNKHYFNPEYTNMITAFSGQTLVNQVQRVIESKVCTRRRKGYYGPEEGKQYIVVFIDDLNMPQKEKYGAQPPIELLRQWMDNMGWYDLDTKEWKYLCDITFIASMLPPSGGRNVVTMRYLRHFQLLYVEPFEADSLQRIFSNILEWYFSSLPTPLLKAITNLKDNVVNSTIEIYKQIQTCKELLPTPAKSHYIYNLRDISKVFQGISKANNRSFKDENDLIKLWAHECSRVFQDRLINVDDQQTFDKMLKEMIQLNFKKDWSSLVTIEPLLWASFVPTIYPDNDTTKRAYSDIYCELTDRDQLKKTCYEQMAEYNNFYSSNRMNLVLFMNAIQHVLKIVRIVTTTYGHALLVGVGGSGRKSLATLSSFIAFQSETLQVDQKNWIEELQKVMKLGGIDQKETVFMYSDTQILRESMVEDICNVLNNGEVPNLFPLEEKVKIIEEMSAYIQGTPNEKYTYFVQQCKKNLHLVICMSPVGEAFRRRLRTFPALVNCTTIDWFLPWPEEALRSTADNIFIKDMNVLDDNLRAGLVQVAVDMQTRVQELTTRYYQELRRYYYVTPTSYLELLNTFKRLKQDRETKIQLIIGRYEAGVDKIVVTEGEVSKMQKVLEDLQPKLEKATIENSQMLIILQKKQKEADGKRAICEVDEKECNVTRDEANALRTDCQKDLDKVLPLLAAANDALENIKKDDMTQLKSFANPPPAASIVMEGVCYAFNEDANVKWKPKEPGSMEKIQDFWDYAKKSLLNDKLIKRVKDFKEDQIKAIPPSKIAKLKVFVQNPMFEKEKVFNASKAAGNLSLWIRAVVDTYEALLVVEPKREQLKTAEEKLRLAEEQLADKKAVLQEVLDLLMKLESDYNKARKDKEDLENQVNRCKVQLERAEKLIKGLGGEKESWRKKAIEYREEAKSVTGDCKVSAGIIAYLGAFPIAYREDTIHSWKELLTKLKIEYSNDFQLQKILCDPITIGLWTNNHKLPNDSFSIDNAIILKNSTRWPLMIDPQTQANTWVKMMESGRKLIILRATQTVNEVTFSLENAVTLGYPVLLENIGEEIDSVYESILQQKIIKQGGSLKMKFGEKMIDYSSDFKFYMTTKLSRPHYPPEICVKVTMLNFQVTLEGLEDQMLNIVVKIEEPAKEEQRQKNIKEFFENKNKQKNTEDLILKLLQESKGDLLDDEVLIETLQKSKIESMEIEEKLKKQEHDREQFNLIRNFYREVAKRVANLYFVILDLALIEPTYQWSLEFYIILFEKSIREAISGKENRSRNIIDKFQISLYESICRSLLEKDKLIFSLLLCLKVMGSEGKVNASEIRFTMVGGTYTEPTFQTPLNIPWLSKKIWCNVCEASDIIPSLKGFKENFMQGIEGWQKIYDSNEPQEIKLPDPWDKQLSLFQKLIILRILRPDKFTNAVQNLIINEMGKQYMEPPPFNLEYAFKDADALTPLIFILSPGADPRLEITNLAEKLGFKNTFSSLSLGQGQGEIAENAIKLAVKEGRWVLLQNCHLAPSFMPELERIHETICNQPASETNHDFRVWLTSMPSNVFPVTLLMRGIKMTYEPPRGLKSNLMRSFTQTDSKKFDDCKKVQEWKKLFFGLNFFHALCLERRKYGPLGWNIPYEFTSADLAISVSQLRMFLNEYDIIPWEALNYMVAEANYGGRVTDPKDRRLIKILLKQFYAVDILKDGYKFSPSGIYLCPPEGQLDDYKEYIKQLPLNDLTEVFGLHSNAEITSAIIETNFVCGTVLSLLPRSMGGKGASPEEILKEKCFQLLQRLPQPFDVIEAAKKHPVKYEESMNTCLQQELIRFNKLLITVRSQLVDLGKAIDGFIVMSTDLDIVFNKVFDNQVPDTWHKVAYPSLKPLGSWIIDFIERLNFMQKWIDQGAPPSFWVSGFFFTQSFLTGTLQNFARKYQIPIDTLQFDYFMVPPDSKEYDISQTPDDGCYIYGLFLDGARWDEENRCLNESKPKILQYSVPYIWLLPTEEKKDNENDKSLYECPVYKTSRRAGTLSTTGHSTNFVISLFVPISPSHTPDHWVKRGVAMLTQTDD